MQEEKVSKTTQRCSEQVWGCMQQAEKTIERRELGLRRTGSVQAWIGSQANRTG